MTDKRLISILRENGYSAINPNGDLMKAMKQAVNEAIQECADNVECDHRIDYVDDFDYSAGHNGMVGDIDKDSILNLKVK